MIYFGVCPVQLYFLPLWTGQEVVLEHFFVGASHHPKPNCLNFIQRSVIRLNNHSFCRVKLFIRGYRPTVRDLCLFLQYYYRLRLHELLSIIPPVVTPFRSTRSSNNSDGFCVQNYIKHKLI